MKRFWVAFACLLTIGLVGAAGEASAADWASEQGGVCKNLKPGRTCYIATAGENSSVLSVGECSFWSLTTFGTPTSVMLQACSDSSCTESKDLLSTGLTGASPNNFVTAGAPWRFIRLATSDSVNLIITCGG